MLRVTRLKNFSQPILHYMCHVGENTVLLEHVRPFPDLELDQQLSVGNCIIPDVLQEVVGSYDMDLIALSQ